MLSNGTQKAPRHHLQCLRQANQHFRNSMSARSVPSGSAAYRGGNEPPVPKYGGCVKSHCSYWQSPPEACMASAQSDFFDFLGLFAQPYSERGKGRAIWARKGKFCDRLMGRNNYRCVQARWGCVKSHSLY